MLLHWVVATWVACGVQISTWHQQRPRLVHDNNLKHSTLHVNHQFRGTHLKHFHRGKSPQNFWNNFSDNHLGRCLKKGSIKRITCEKFKCLSYRTFVNFSWQKYFQDQKSRGILTSWLKTPSRVGFYLIIWYH